MAPFPGQPRELREVSRPCLTTHGHPVEPLRWEWGGEQSWTWLAHNTVAVAFLQPLEGCDHLLARSIIARPQPQLPFSSGLEHRKLDPQLGYGRAGLPFLDPSADEPEQLGRARKRMPDGGDSLVRFF